MSNIEAIAAIEAARDFAALNLQRAEEQQRLAALHEYQVLDAPADDELEAVVRVAAMVAGVPTATLNLIDEHRQCQLTTVGFDGGDSARSDSMCAVQLSSKQFVHVPDAAAHPLYQDNPWVTGALADVRFYASAPLVTPAGHALGTLCVFDSQPRELSSEQIARLQDLADVVLALFERRRQARVNAQLAREADARQRFIEAVLDTIDVGVVAADPNGHLTLFNRASRDWHGLDADPTLNPSDFAARYALFRPDGTTPLPAEEIPLVRALHEGAVCQAEMVIRPHSAPARRIAASGRALRATDGTVLGAVVAMTDVTRDRAQRAELENAHTDLAAQRHQLAAAVAELQRSNAELESFAGVVSHDLLAPLSVVKGYLELLGDWAEDSGDGQVQRWVDTAAAGVTRMNDLVRAVLAYARAGHATCQTEPTSLNTVVDQVLLDVREQLRAGGASVDVPASLPTVDGDPTLVRQLLQNLLCNAIKYQHPDRPCRISITAEQDGDRWRIGVTDNGIGIPAEHRSRVFTMFTQLDPAARGDGIGLATCQRIVRRHGGRIWAAEGTDGGTSMFFTLPPAV